MDKFTKDEINLMCVFAGQDKAQMIADIKNVIPHLLGSSIVKIAEQVIKKLEEVTEEEYGMILSKLLN